MHDHDEQFQDHLAEAVRVLRMRRLLEIILPFAPNVLTVNCPEQLVRWAAERAGWVVALDTSPARPEQYQEMGLDNVDLFHGTLTEYRENPDAWDWRLGFDLVVADGVLGYEADPASELERMRAWAPWVLAVAPSGGDSAGTDAFKALFTRVIVCEDDGESVIVLGR